MACLVLYMTLTFLFSIPLPRGSHLKSWDPNFSLILGNEQTQDRPWQGTISDLYIANQVLAKSELIQAFASPDDLRLLRQKAVAFYSLSGQDSYPDQIGESPRLVWQGDRPECQGNCQPILNSQHWLATERSANWITEKIRETSQFTLITTVSTSKVNQTGPARIISLSGSPYHRNFTLGQEGPNLAFRIRTPITGENGLRPELIVPDIFSDTTPHLIAITYANSLLQVFIDSVEHSFYLELIPGKSALLNIFPGEIDDNLLIYALVYYSLIFVPLGLILSLMTMFYQGNVGFVILWSFMGGLAPVLLLEVILATGTGRAISLSNILLGAAIMTFTLLLVSGGIRFWSWLTLSRGIRKAHP
ncbi:hypothetical protein [Acaryochloris sp. IP29b_bin.148]|uniref:hypothetical protein n=1 Tax=Acaryochloris sp. IP29b_bin.148 TaxID=2969218 RepID=UPI00260C0525|nr:hypothetical protein [Acaryochloris sp. IP29b_bin.148]